MPPSFHLDTDIGSSAGHLPTIWLRCCFSTASSALHAMMNLSGSSIGTEFPPCQNCTQMVPDVTLSWALHEDHHAPTSHFYPQWNQLEIYLSAIWDWAQSLLCFGLLWDGTRSWKSPLYVLPWAFCKAGEKIPTENVPNSNLTGLRKNWQVAHNVSAAHQKW